MPATRTRTARPTAALPGIPPDAIALLKADHKSIAGLFSDYERTRSIARKKGLVAQICRALGVHAQVEEEIFYPAVKGALKDHFLVPEATVEHACISGLMAQIRDIEPDGEMFDARVRVLSEYVRHHVKEEQDEMFPKARASLLDLRELGTRMAARRFILLGQVP